MTKRKQKKEVNIAYIDAQNLHLWTSSERRKVDFGKFRTYLKDKFNVQEAYYFLWFLDEDEQKLYTWLQKAWYILIFREHSSKMKGKKKGNVDVDICFEMMRRVVEDDDFDKIVLVTWDGDYIKPVKRLIEQDRFKKIIFPNKKYSSLYKQLKAYYAMNLSIKDVRKKIEYIQADQVGTQKKKHVSRKKLSKQRRYKKKPNEVTSKKDE